MFNISFFYNDASISGIYDYRNPAVNIINDHSFSIDETVIHEHVHAMLAQKSTYGSLCFILKHINKLDNRCEDFLKYLYSASKILQENIATYIEFSLVNIKYGEKRYLREIEKLKYHNEEYYGYLKKLLFINDYSKDINRNVEVIYSLGLIAMSPDILRIPIEVFR
jgi:hypothetical protein